MTGASRAGRPEIKLSVDQESLKRLGLKLKAEEGGARLKRQLTAKLRIVVAPAVSEIKSSASSMHRKIETGRGATRHKLIESGDAASLGAAIAASIKTSVRMTGRSAGVSVRATKKGMPREFRNAPMRMNRKSFRHKVFGHDYWVIQIGIPDYFDRPLWSKRLAYRAAIRTEVDAMFKRIAH